MKFSSKFVNFFTSKYYSNIKYNHSFSFLLRIFFERAAKVQHTVANLGNVYRNSKWSDLKVQNIKGLHLSSFITITFIFILFAFSLFIIFFRLDKTLLQSSISVFFWPLVYFIDIISYLWLCIALFLYAFLNKIQMDTSAYFYDNLNNRLDYASSKSISKTNVISGLPTTLATNNIDNSWVQLLHSLYKSKYNIDRLNNIESSNNNINVNEHSTLNIFLKTSTTSYIFNTNSNSYSYDLSKKYATKTSNVLKDKTFSTMLSLSNLNSSSQVLTDSYSNSINQNLQLANQTRWAYKMSPISEKLVRDNFNYTQAKSLLGSSLVNSLSSSNNIWSSNSLSQVKDNSTFMLAANLTNLNHFEDSRSWTMKKMFYGLDMSTYNLALSSSSTATTTELNSSLNSLLSAYLLDYNLSYSHLSLGSNYMNYQTNYSLSNYNILNNDSNIYQDSYNNFIFSLASTSLVSNFNNFKHTSTATKEFNSCLK